ncbi:ATP-binding cassette domain-containing protein [Alkalihalobacillus sp. LMS39]|uniref:sulfate/molybdate ABC transporter ATP-binding protein n=1 Tax=Alkalihalobacillus sp. LMS39 TaxID=2924032 RepID=UPI001FB46DCA|nr:ATP-binding cassette domain-containing protein [Alkalihalobacillus sp. LMS39]UOE93199.1 ATP-binding cassette domain-containing protein [Alkalihalobacillus sp. LMS39]
MLHVNIQKKVRSFHLDVRFDISNGITGLLGPSGSGKSLTLQCLAGIQKPDSGEISLNNHFFFHKANRISVKTQQRKIGFVFQHYALFPHLTVKQNIEYGMFELPKKERQQKAEVWIQSMDLIGLEHHFPSQLSGGQQQRTALARTLATKPDILLLDEPFSALDTALRSKLTNELIQLVEQHFHGPVLLVTHDIEEAYHVCHSLVLLHNGKVKQTGKTPDVFLHPQSYEAAQLLGCRNLFPITSFEPSSGIVFINENISFHVDKTVSNTPTYIGIHPHDIHVLSEGGRENTIHATVHSVVEKIHTTTLFVSFCQHELEIDVPKGHPSTFQADIYIHLPKDKLFIF